MFGLHHYGFLVAHYGFLVADGKAVRVITLGGSVPYGNNCVRPTGEHHRACSWPARLVHALRLAYPAASITHDHLASGGNGVVHILSTLGIVLREHTDLILLDSLVNDAWRSGSLAASQALEALVRTTRVLAPSAALLVVEAAAPGLGDEVQREKRKVLDHYRVATLDWKAATGRNPSLWRPGPIPGTSATDINHPSWETHQMVADALASHWSRAIRRSCRREQAHAGPKLVDANHRDASRAADRWWPSVPLWSVEQLSKFDVCTAPLSVYTTVGGTRVGVPSLSRGWRFFADRPNKYGWIAEEADARIRFELRFGAAPRFCLTYLRSYEKVGRLEIAIPATGFRAVIDALWADRASQSDVMWFGSTQGHDMTISYNTMYVPVEPNSTHVLEATLIETPGRQGGNKFKIIQLVSC